MTSPRKVNNKNPERHRVLKYLREHPKELQYIVGDYIARHEIIQKAKKEVFDDIYDYLCTNVRIANSIERIIKLSDLKQIKKKHLLLCIYLN